MSKDPNLFSHVRLVTNRFANEGAPKGTLGFVIEKYPNGDLEIEVTAPDGSTHAQFVARIEDIEFV